MGCIEVNRPEELESRIGKAEREVADLKSRIEALCYATPKDLFPANDGWTTYELVRKEVSELFEMYNDALSELNKLYLIDLNKELLVDQYAELEEQYEKTSEDTENDKNK